MFGVSSTWSRSAWRAPVSLRSGCPSGRNRSSLHHRSHVLPVDRVARGGLGDGGEHRDPGAPSGETDMGVALRGLRIDQRVMKRAARPREGRASR